MDNEFSDYAEKAIEQISILTDYFRNHEEKRVAVDALNTLAFCVGALVGTHEREMDELKESSS
jgi:hypothetical protein